ncbi:MAG: hypothetical protein WC046_00160 [Candidatus Bathyarchaeia archaeon]
MKAFPCSGATGDYSIYKGYPCIVINGTIQNDYDKDYYFGINANVYKFDGYRIEPVLTVNSHI